MSTKIKTSLRKVSKEALISSLTLLIQELLANGMSAPVIPEPTKPTSSKKTRVKSESS